MLALQQLLQFSSLSNNGSVHSQCFTTLFYILEVKITLFNLLHLHKRFKYWLLSTGWPDTNKLAVGKLCLWDTSIVMKGNLNVLLENIITFVCYWSFSMHGLNIFPTVMLHKDNKYKESLILFLWSHGAVIFIYFYILFYLTAQNILALHFV